LHLNQDLYVAEAAQLEKVERCRQVQRQWQADEAENQVFKLFRYEWRTNIMITIIGAGSAGKALGRALLRKGKKVFFGVSNISKYQNVVRDIGENAQLGTVQEALSLSSDVVILAVPYPAALEIAASVPNWNQRILVDISTPWLPDFSGLSVGLTTSGAEKIAEVAPSSRVVKAFNTMGAECIEDPSLVKGKSFMPVCSDDEPAKKEVMKLGELIGLDAVDAGRLSNARATEPMVLLWLQLTFKLSRGRTFEFGLLEKTITRDELQQPVHSAAV
jgi:predicted dinucleotide-binding enzyme